MRRDPGRDWDGTDASRRQARVVPGVRAIIVTATLLPIVAVVGALWSSAHHAHPAYRRPPARNPGAPVLRVDQPPPPISVALDPVRPILSDVVIAAPLTGLPAGEPRSFRLDRGPRAFDDPPVVDLMVGAHRGQRSVGPQQASRLIYAPEPASIALMLLAGVGLASRRRRSITTHQ